MSYDTTLVAPPPPPHAAEAPSVAQAVAPWWHTLGLFALLGLSTFYTHRHASGSVDAHAPRLPRYLLSIALEWLLCGAVFLGIRRKREFLREAFANRRRGWAQSVGLGAVIYLIGFMAIAFTSGLLYFTPLFHKRNEAVILALAPHTTLEFLLWFCVSLTAGITEELIFRGYLLQQFTAWTTRPALAIALAALLFGGVHLYEGPAAILPLCALALVYGFAVRAAKGDLRAVIVAHTLQDFVVALLLLARPWLEQHQPRP